MGVLDRLKTFFQRRNTKALPEASNEMIVNRYNNNQINNPYVLQRQDGSILEISPVLDDLGNQAYEQIYNTRTCQMQCIPKFRIMSEELKTIINPQILNHTILMDINPQLLNDSYYADFIANSMLSADRMEKVINNYANYAGTIRMDERGKPKKLIDEGVITTLRATREENARQVNADRIAAEETRREQIMQNANNQEVHIKTSHAGKLSQEDLSR